MYFSCQHTNIREQGNLEARVHMSVRAVGEKSLLNERVTVLWFPNDNDRLVGQEKLTSWNR